MIQNTIARIAILMLALAAGGASGGTLAQFRTVFGDIEVELFDQDKPATVQNFRRYVETGRYQNTFFHRLIPGFVAQGGGFLTANPLATNDFAEFYNVGTFPAVTNEFAVGPRVSNTFGTIAMAKLPDNPNSATSQWFFNLANNSANLDNQNGGFTVFGRVVGGTNVLARFNQFSYFDHLVDLGWFYGTNDVRAQLFDSLPVTYSAFPPYPPWYSELIYVDVSLLSVRVRRLTNDNCRIVWQSVAGKTNHVEYVNKMPPGVWKTLVSTNGTGSNMNVTDSSTNAVRRFYRVTVDY